jgi:hypothetical protein
MVEMQNVGYQFSGLRHRLRFDRHRTHRYTRLARNSGSGLSERCRAAFASIALQPFPRPLGVTVTVFPLGRIITIALYMSISLYLLTLVDAPILSSHFVDDVAFRAAWVSLTQIPLVYFLSAKRGPINLLAGMSYERINWAHRWVGRMLLLSATVHVGIMKSSISTKDILQSHDSGMSVVRYGIATYAILVWIAVSSIIPLRRLCHRFFYINHYISTLVFLVIALQHVPTYARIPIYLASSIVALDKVLVAYFFLRNNISLTPSRRFVRARSTRKFIAGHPVHMTTPSPSIATLATPVSDSTTVIRIADIPFTWKPGQHIRLTIPSLSLTSHPFTPANCSAMPPPPLPPRKDIESGSTTQPRQKSDMLLLVKAKTGLTQRLAVYHTSWLARPCPNASSPPEDTLTAYIDGPYGLTPDWHTFPHLVLVSSSSGISFSLAILDHLEQLCFTSDAILTTHITLLWTTRHLDPVFESTITSTLARCASTLHDFGITLTASFWHTCPCSAERRACDVFAHLRPAVVRRVSERPELRIRHPDEIYEEWERAEAEEEEWAAKGDMGPFVLHTGGYESDEEERSSVGTAQWSADEEDPFADQHEVHDEAYRPLPPPVSVQARVEEEGCRCALIQHQRGTVGATEKGAEWIVQRFGARPDVQGLLGSLREERTMVAVCANDAVGRDVSVVAARVNGEVARGRRQGRVHVHIENQG